MSNLRYFDGVRYGSFTDLEVLVDPSDNSIFVSQPSMARLLDWEPDDARKKLASKSLKVFAGKDLAHGKKVEGRDSAGRVNQVVAIPFDTFLIVVYWQMVEGNDCARSLVLAGFADSFSSIVLEQCGIRLSLEERQQTISYYLDWYHKFQDWVRDTHLSAHGLKPDPDYYRRLATLINMFLFGNPHFNSNRLNNAQTPELRRLENFQMQFLESSTARRLEDPLNLLSQYIKAISVL